MIYKFTAKWCSSCLITNQVFENLILEYQKYDFKIDFIAIDVDSADAKDLDFKLKYGIDDKSILPVIVFTDVENKESERMIGEQDYDQLLQAIDRNIRLNNKSSPSSNFKPKKTDFLTKLGNIFK